MNVIENVSAVILAGGKSSRMGKCKAELDFKGTALIEHQAKKLAALGIEDIMLSGYAKPVAGTRFVPDAYPHKGPLSGIHAALAAARGEHCLVLAVDAPLVPEDTLLELIRVHLARSNNVTVLLHSGKIEPLIGVYARSLHSQCEQILKTDNTSVRELYKFSGVSSFPYIGDERFLLNCNTPEEYKTVCAIK